MGELALAQIMLTMSLQKAGFKPDGENFTALLSDKSIAERVVINLTPASKRAQLIDILKKNESTINYEDKKFIDELINENSDKFITGRGQWD